MNLLSEKQKTEKKDNPYEPKGFAGTVYVVLHDMVCILAVIVVSFVFAARLVGVSGYSMYPTLVGAEQGFDTAGDYLVLRSNFLSSHYQQGDIVVASVPTFEDGKPIVKRVIAVGGQTLSFRAGDDGHLHVYVDGVLLPCRVANIGGNNYFKLQDLADALGFFVDYDKETRTVIIAP